MESDKKDKMVTWRTREQPIRPAKVRHSDKATALAAATKSGSKSSARAKPQHATDGCPIVVIGASAGGLDACNRFFKQMPVNSGMAFVLVQHLHPTHKGLMPELLREQTTMPVQEATQQLEIEPNHVYVAPPSHYIAVKRDKLVLQPRATKRPAQTGIDFALCSLAMDQQEDAVGIIFSGTGSLGTEGLNAIKRAGGLVLVQDPITAEYEEMPRSVIAPGVEIDHLLAPEAMPEALLRHVQTIQRRPKRGAASQHGNNTLTGLDNILAAIREQGKFDFSQYRKSMILRRIQRRMALLRIEDINRYAEHLYRDPGELVALRRNFSIGVTAFFRDPAAFNILAKRVIPKLVARATPETPVRVWVPACTTGEEAYSIAILLMEQFAAVGKEPSIQIFATDIDEDALVIARHGTYADNSLAALPPERRNAFFVAAGKHHSKVKRQVRDSIVFARHNLIGDPPLSRMDLISCRNMLIYIQSTVQEKVISMLHFALNDGGHLMLGPAESISGDEGLFEQVSRKWRIYRRIRAAHRKPVQLPTAMAQRPAGAAVPRSVAQPNANLCDLMEKLLLKEFSPAAVLINPAFELLSVQGPAVNYLEFPPGTPSRHLMHLVRPGLRARTHAACKQALDEFKIVRDERAQVHRDGRYVPCTLSVRPIRESKNSDVLLLVVFQDRAESNPSRSSPPAASDEFLAVRLLEQELQETRADLNSAIIELEKSNEGLVASNEEVTSMNEELQSANEELETSKEELQSLNEELTTVNNQLHEKLNDLDTANSDITNLLTATNIAIVLLHRDGRIKRFSPPASRLLNLRIGDIGRPLRDFSSKLIDDQLFIDARVVIDSAAPVEKEVRDDDGRWYLRRTLSYNRDDRIGGVVITFIDMTAHVEAEMQTRRLAAVLKESSDAITVRDLNGQFTEWNRGAEHLYGYSEAEALKMNICDLLCEGSRAQALEISQRVARGDTVSSFETQYLTRDKRTIDVWSTLTLLRDASGQPAYLAATERDVTARRRAADEIKMMNAQLEQRIAERTSELQHSEQQIHAIFDAAVDAVITIDRTGAIVTINKSVVRMFGFDATELIGKNIKMLMPPIESRRHDGYLRRYAEHRVPRIIGKPRQLAAKRKDGTIFPIELSVNEVDHFGLYVGFIRDLTDHHALQNEVIAVSTLEQTRIGQELHDGIQQELAGLAMLSKSLFDALKLKKMDSESQLAGRVANGISDTNRHVRMIARGLVASPVGKSGLATALGTLAAAVTSDYKVSCRLECPRSISVKDSTFATHLYRIAQEAVGNALKHSGAHVITIYIGETEAELILRIEDNGLGMQDDQSPNQGIGLRLIRHRCQLMGGDMTIQSKVGGGTSIRCSIPRR